MHNVSTNITIGTVAQGAQSVTRPPRPRCPMRIISQADFDTRRAKMLAVCGTVPRRTASPRRSSPTPTR